MEPGHLTRKEQNARFAFEQCKIETELAAVQTHIATEIAAIEAHTACKQEKS